MLSEMRVGTRSGDTAGCWTRTRVCDVKRFGKTRDRTYPETPPNRVSSMMSIHLRRRMATPSLTLMSWRNISCSLSISNSGGLHAPIRLARAVGAFGVKVEPAPVDWAEVPENVTILHSQREQFPNA